MRLTHYLYILPLTFLAACSSEKLEQSQPATDHPSGPIQLTAGIVEGGSAAVTRAGEENADHNKHLALDNLTKLALQVSGTWTNHDPVSVVETTTATAGVETATDSKHNSVTCNPILYWDDYGTADEANASTGRTTGLTIYGAAINGKDTVPTISNWTAQGWAVPADQSTNGSKPADKDLLISNNVQASTAVSGKELDTGNYKFDERNYGKLLIFKHALSKITVNVKAGTGFEALDAADIWLTSNEVGAAATTTEWPYTTGKINITTGEVTLPGTPATITMCPATTATTGYNVTKEALVIPGSKFTSDNATIVRIKANDNNYYVTAEKIRAAISGNHTTDGAYSTEAGKNYIINVTLNKTAIQVTATVTNWTEVIAEEVSPKINISDALGATDQPLGNDFTFSFYRSTSLGNGYSTKSGDYYPEEAYVSNSSGDWVMHETLYWPNHDIHYQFRGVWPQTTTDTDTTKPHVEDGTGDTNGCQVIKVQNTAYTANTFPSDLMIARPEIDPATECASNEHEKKSLYDDGICATEGKINLNFRYMMSQVEVYLTTNDGGSDMIELTKVKVELVDIFSTGDVKLGSREVVPTGTAAAYVLGDQAATPNTYTYDGSTKKGHTENKAIVPQDLTDVKFKITITNSGNTKDVYYAPVKDIYKEGSTTDKVTPNGKWESGYHYVYNLKLTKTAVQVTATLADWKTVTASEEVWF